MDINAILNTIIENWDAILIAMTGLGLFLKEQKKGKNVSDALMIAINTLKDESKMDKDGHEFKIVETMEKAEQVAEVMESKGSGLQKFEETLEIINTRKGIKIGSHKGKPIYLEDAIGIFGMLKKLAGR